MPLIIAILVIIVSCSYLSAKWGAESRHQAQRTFDSRKTYAELEQHILNQYIKQGKTFDEAFELTREELMEQGFVPCIPRTEYIHTSPDYYSSQCKRELSEYNSQDVKDMRRWYCQLCNEQYKNDPSYRQYIDNCNQWVADNYGDPGSDHKHQMHKLKNRTNRIPIGSYITTSRFGTCEVVGHDYKHLMYAVRVLSTGEERLVSMGDTSIMKME